MPARMDPRKDRIIATSSSDGRKVQLITSDAPILQIEFGTAADAELWLVLLTKTILSPDPHREDAS